VRQAIVVTGASTPQIYRTKKAKVEEREIGVRGRPKALKTEKKTLLVIALIETRENQTPMTYSEVKQKVKIINIFFLIFLFLHYTYLFKYYN
jgi:hypothetical protein